MSDGMIRVSVDESISTDAFELLLTDLGDVRFETTDQAKPDDKAKHPSYSIDIAHLATMLIDPLKVAGSVVSVATSLVKLVQLARGSKKPSTVKVTVNGQTVTIDGADKETVQKVIESMMHQPPAQS